MSTKRFPEMSDREKELAMQFGDWLKTSRNRAGISQATLAKDVGMNETTINHLEAGKRPPSIRTIVKLADFFDTDVTMALTERTF